MSEKTVRAAQEMLEALPVFFDTETTGLDCMAQVVEIAVVDVCGKVLLNTLVKPTVPIPPQATAIHGITDEMVADAPGFAEVRPELVTLLQDKTVVIYNAQYDLRLLRQTARAVGLENTGPMIDSWCAMLVYAEHRGEWDSYHGNWRWATLERAARECKLEMPADLHRALADAELTRRLVIWMAGQEPAQQ